MTQAKKLLLSLGLAWYVIAGTGLPIALHHSLDHSHGQHAHCKADRPPAHGIYEAPTSPGEHHAEDCPVCEQLFRVAKGPALAGDPQGFAAEYRPNQLCRPLVAAAVLQPLLVCQPPRAPPTA